MSDDEISEDGPLGGGLSVVDARRMALVLLVDSDGSVTIRSGVGYSHRQIADMLRVLSTDLEAWADKHGEEPLMDNERFHSHSRSRES